MAELRYQRPDDARREQRAEVRRRWFGLSREDVWRALATEIDATYEPRRWNGGRVVARVAEWEVVLDTYTVSTGGSAVTFTRMRAPYVNRDGLRFTVYRAGWLTNLGKMLGMRDIEVGDAAFDDAFVVKGTDPSKLRDLVAYGRVRELMMAQPQIRLRVKDDEGVFRKVFPEGVDELYFECVGVIKDIDRLKALYELFAEVLAGLCAIGSAYERDPGVQLK